MPADILGIRANDEIQKRFKELAEASDFKSKGDFLDHLLIRYAAEETAEQVPTLDGAVSAVKELTDRICKILIGTGKIILTNQEKIQADAETREQEANDKNVLLQHEIEKLEADAEANQSLITALNETVAQSEIQIKTLNANLTDKTALINTYMVKIEEQAKQIQFFEYQTREIEKLQEKLEESRRNFAESQDSCKRIELDSEKALMQQEKQLRREAQEEHARLRLEIEQLLQKINELITLKQGG